ncbi:MAG: hypothetical protein AAGD38_23415, partial [Acidobacteriota bacterium]
MTTEPYITVTASKRDQARRIARVRGHQRKRFDRDDETFTLVPTDADDPASLVALRSRNGDLWFGGHGPSLLRLDADGQIER